MVHILPPVGWQPGPAPSVQLSAANEPALTISTTASAIIPASVAAALPASTEPVVFASPVTELLATESAPVATGTPWLWWAVGSVAALVVGGLALAAWPSGKEKFEQPSPAAVAEAATAAPSPVDERPKPADAATDVVDDTKDVASTPIAAVESADPPPADPEPKPAEITANKPTLPLEKKPATKTAEIVPSKTPSDTSTPAKPGEPLATDSHAPVLKFDPLDFDPNHLNTAGKSSAVPKTVTKSVPDQPAGEPPANNLAATSGVATPDRVPVAVNAPPKPASNQSITVRRGPPGDAPPPAAAKALATPMKSFQVSEMPLLRFVETLSNISGSGITLDPLALEFVGVSPSKSITVNAQDATLESILRGAVTRERLDVAALNDRLRIVLPKADAPHTIDYDVKDLVNGTDAAAIGQLIEHFIAPQTWKSNGGLGTLQVKGTVLHIEQSEAVRRQVVIFCERLRVARGLTIRSRYPSALLSVDLPYEKLGPKLQERTTFTFLAATRFADVVRNWEDMTGLTILVDWSALAEAELSPSTPVACSAIDRTWQDVFDGVLEPLGITWWAVNGDTIQITSPSALDEIQRIEFYRLPSKLGAKFASEQALIASLQRELKEHAGKQGTKHEARIKLDEPSGQLIVLGSADVHRFLGSRFAPKKQ